MQSFASFVQVMDCIQGLHGKKLPWEAPRLTPQTRRKLGIFKSSVAALLSRDPLQRPSMAHFCYICNRVLSGSTTVQA